MPYRLRSLDASLDSNVSQIPSYVLTDNFPPGIPRDNQEYAWSGTYTYSVFPKHISYMEDVVGNQGSFNPVKHREIKAYLQPLQDFREYTNSPLIWLQHLGFGANRVRPKELYLPQKLGGNDSFLWKYDWNPFPSPATLSDWSVEAFNRFHTQVPTTVSLPNFLYELKEMKSMIPSLDRKSVSKTAANNFLAFEFGVKPFVSDIKAILSLSESVQKRIKHLLEEQGKTSDLSYNKEINYNDPFVIGQDLSDPWQNGLEPGRNRIEFRRQSAKVKFHCGAKLTQNLEGLSDSLTVLKALSSSSGFSSPARVVWNAIPYSFVVDWFFHVGKLLDSLTIQPFGGEYSVSDVGYSVKSEATYLAFQVMANNQVVEGNPLIGTVYAKRYERLPGFPANSLFLTDGLLDPKQMVLALAMLEQKRR